MTTALELPTVHDGPFAALKPGLFDLKLLWRSNPEHYDDVITKFQDHFMTYFFEYLKSNNNVILPLKFLEKQISMRPALLGDQKKKNSFILRMTKRYMVQPTYHSFSAIQVLFKLEYEKYLKMKRGFGCTTFFDLNPNDWVTNKENGLLFQEIVKVIPIRYNSEIEENFHVTFVFHQAMNDDGTSNPNSAFISAINCPTFVEFKKDADKAAEAIRQVNEFKANRSVCFKPPAAGGGNSDEENDRPTIPAYHSSDDVDANELFGVVVPNEHEDESDDEYEAEQESDDESEAEQESDDEPEADADADADAEPEADSDSEDESNDEPEAEAKPEAVTPPTYAEVTRTRNGNTDSYTVVPANSDSDLDPLHEEDDTASIIGGQCLQQGSSDSDNELPSGANLDNLNEVEGVDTHSSTGTSDSSDSSGKWLDQAHEGTFPIDELKVKLRETFDKKATTTQPTKQQKKRQRKQINDIKYCITDKYNLDFQDVCEDLGIKFD